MLLVHDISENDLQFNYLFILFIIRERISREKIFFRFFFFKALEILGFMGDFFFFFDDTEASMEGTNLVGINEREFASMVALNFEVDEKGEGNH